MVKVEQGNSQMPDSGHVDFSNIFEHFCVDLVKDEKQVHETMQ